MMLSRGSLRNRESFYVRNWPDCKPICARCSPRFSLSVRAETETETETAELATGAAAGVTPMPPSPRMTRWGPHAPGHAPQERNSETTGLSWNRTAHTFIHAPTFGETADPWGGRSTSPQHLRWRRAHGSGRGRVIQSVSGRRDAQLLRHVRTCHLLRRPRPCRVKGVHEEVFSNTHSIR